MDNNTKKNDSLSAIFVTLILVLFVILYYSIGVVVGSILVWFIVGITLSIIYIGIRTNKNNKIILQRIDNIEDIIRTLRRNK